MRPWAQTKSAVHAAHDQVILASTTELRHVTHQASGIFCVWTAGGLVTSARKSNVWLSACSKHASISLDV